MKIDIQPASFEEKQLLRRLLELYTYDLSEYVDCDLNEQGEFGYKYLDQYWQETDRHPFLIRFGSKPAGFVLINNNTHVEGIDHSIAEFFILKKYRRKGIGQKAVTEVLERFDGSWEIRALKTNERAINFWDVVLAAYTDKELTKIKDGTSDWSGPIWIVKKEKVQNKSAHTTSAIAPR